MNLFKNFTSKAFTANGNIQNKKEVVVIQNNYSSKDVTDIYRSQLSLFSKVDDVSEVQRKLEQRQNSLNSDFSNLSQTSCHLSSSIKKKNIKIKNDIESLRDSINRKLDKLKNKLKQNKELCKNNMEKSQNQNKTNDDHFKSIEKKMKSLINEDIKKDKIINGLGEKIKYLENENENLKTELSNIKSMLNNMITIKQINETEKPFKPIPNENHHKEKKNQTVKNEKKVSNLIRQFESFRIDKKKVDDL